MVKGHTKRGALAPLHERGASEGRAIKSSRGDTTPSSLSNEQYPIGQLATKYSLLVGKVHNELKLVKGHTELLEMHLRDLEEIVAQISRFR